MTRRSTELGTYAANTEEHNDANRPSNGGAADRSLSASVRDAILLTRICQRDEQALDLLYDRYGTLVYTIAPRITHDRAAAKEVTQDVFHAVQQQEAAMGLSADDEFLNVIAHQARVAYARQQLAVCRDALQHCQADAAREASGHTRRQEQLADYTRQIARWQEYLGCLGATPKVLKVGEMPLL